MRESHIDWIFKGPASLAILVNLIFLIRIMWVSIPWIALMLCAVYLYLPPFCKGTDYQVAVRTYSRDPTVLQSIQGSFGANTPLWNHVSPGINRARTGH